MSRDSRSKRRGFAFRRPEATLITDARRSPLENWEHRKRVYNWIQFSRVPFLLAAGASYMWWHNWILATVLFIISVPLPGIAVVIANGAGEPKDERTKQVYKPQVARAHRDDQLHQLDSGKARALPADPTSTNEASEAEPAPPTVIDHD